MKLFHFFFHLANQYARILPDAEVPEAYESALTLVSGWCAQSDGDPELLQLLRSELGMKYQAIVDRLAADMAPVVAARLAEIERLTREAEDKHRAEQEVKMQAERERQAELDRQAAEARVAEMQALEERAMQRALEALRAEQANKA